MRVCECGWMCAGGGLRVCFYVAVVSDYLFICSLRQ